MTTEVCAEVWRSRALAVLTGNDERMNMLPRSSSQQITRSLLKFKPGVSNLIPIRSQEALKITMVLTVSSTVTGRNNAAQMVSMQLFAAFFVWYTLASLAPVAIFATRLGQTGCCPTRRVCYAGKDALGWCFAFLVAFLRSFLHLCCTFLVRTTT